MDASPCLRTPSYNWACIVQAMYRLGWVDFSLPMHTVTPSPHLHPLCIAEITPARVFPGDPGKTSRPGPHSNL